MKSGKDNGYFNAIVLYALAFVAFLGAFTLAYFSAVGLYFGQGVVEGDVWADYKYECVNLSESQSQCTAYNTSVETNAYQQYELQRDEINSNARLFLGSISIFFALLGLVALFMALKASRIGMGKGKDKREEY